MLFVAIRLVENPWPVVVGSVTGGLAGLWRLSRQASERPRLATVRVVVAWLVSALAVVHLVGLSLAIANLE